MSADLGAWSHARHIAFDTIDSTNAAALRCARDGERGPLWITARVQTAGRGRRGRAWHSPPGNCYASLLLTAPCAPALAPQLSFVTALALHDALAQLWPPLESRLQLKWPNDLLLDGAKLAGILLETETLPAARSGGVVADRAHPLGPAQAATQRPIDEPTAPGFPRSRERAEDNGRASDHRDNMLAVAIGAGVNCVTHPADATYPATDLASAGVPAAAEAVFSALCTAMGRRLAQWQAGQAFDTTRSAWLERTAPLGEPIRVRTPMEMQGAFAGVDQHGRLLLRDAAGVTRAFAAGDVAPATPLPSPPPAGSFEGAST